MANIILKFVYALYEYLLMVIIFFFILFGICMLICFFKSTSDDTFFDLITQSLYLEFQVSSVITQSFIYSIHIYESGVSFFINLFSFGLFEDFDLGFFINLFSFGLFEDFDDPLYLIISNFFYTIYNFIINFDNPYRWICILSFYLVHITLFCLLVFTYSSIKSIIEFIIKFIINYIFKK